MNEVPHMKNPKCTRTRDLIAAFYDNELPCETSYGIQEHLNRCEPCRAFGTVERGFTRSAREGLPQVAPPEGLFARVREGLDAEDRGDVAVVPGFPASGRTPVGRWMAPLRFGYAAAAALLAGVLMLPVVELYAPGSVTGVFDALGGVRHTSGVLVCIECWRLGVPVEQHRGCDARGHRTGLLCEDTGVWNLVVSDTTRPLLSDPTLRGEGVVVEGKFIEDIRYVDARSIRLASR